jgi:hypothetical protein
VKQCTLVTSARTQPHSLTISKAAGPENVSLMRIRTLTSFLLYLISEAIFHPSAEFMLDVIGAGATAVSTHNWHQIWNASENMLRLQQELDIIHSKGRSRPSVEATIHSKFATPWLYQMVQLLKRDASAHWRDPTYVLSKLSLSLISGLYIGFTFFKSKDSQQGTQDKLFVRTSISSVALPAHRGCFYRLYSWQLSLGTFDFHISYIGAYVFWT